MSNTWTIGDTTFVGHADLSGEIEIIRLLEGERVVTIKVPARHLMIFLRNRLVEMVNDRLELAQYGWELAEYCH